MAAAPQVVRCTCNMSAAIRCSSLIHHHIPLHLQPVTAQDVCSINFILSMIALSYVYPQAMLYSAHMPGLCGQLHKPAVVICTMAVCLRCMVELTMVLDSLCNAAFSSVAGVCRNGDDRPQAAVNAPPPQTSGLSTGAKVAIGAAAAVAMPVVALPAMMMAPVVAMPAGAMYLGWRACKSLRSRASWL